MTNYNITITSDIVCPWCYIGHTRLSKAIKNHQSQFPEDKFHLKYLPFYLQPPARDFDTQAPPFPVPTRKRQEYVDEKFGRARAAQMTAALTQVAASEGLDFRYGGLVGSSRNGHRLVHHAQGRGGEQAQNDVMLGLWRRYFEREVDITALDVLVEVGVEAGLGSADEVREFLESGRDGEEVDELAERARDEDGVSGVPFYVVQDMWAVSGAQEPTAFEMLFKRYKQMEEAKKAQQQQQAGGEELKGEACGRNGNGCL